MNTLEIMIALNDPLRKDGMIKMLLGDVLTIEDEHENKHELVSLGGLYIDANNFRMPGLPFRIMKTVALRDDDIFLLTYPKTGTHWINSILMFLLAKGPIDDMPSTLPCSLDFHSVEVINAFASPRVLQTHGKPELLPEDTFKKGRKLVLTFRNPKDTAVSLFYFLQSQTAFGNGLRISWNSFLEHFMKESFFFYNYFDYYNTWQTFIESNKDVSVYVVHFEDMKMNGVEELQKLQSFLGCNHSEDRLQQILDKCQITNLRNDILEGKISPFFHAGVHSALYRKGEVGGWKTQFTVAQNEQMDAIIAEKFKNSIFKINDLSLEI